MATLGKIGYHQSYTYFTWRNTKQELTEYLTDLSAHMADYYRPNFFVNTPDINPFFLQSGNPAAFAIRAVLAATMSPSWGVYSGFELFEHEVNSPGREEYLDSEKYEFRPRDFNAEPNLNLLIGQLNNIRERHPALQQLRDVAFHTVPHDEMIAFSKVDGDDVVLTVCSLSPDHDVTSEVELDFAALGFDPSLPVTAYDELTGDSFQWGPKNFVKLYPAQPAHILRLSQ